MKTVYDIDIAGKKILLRADYNVPLENGKITDDYRIKQSLPTLEYILERTESVVIISHLGRPEGEYMSEYSLQPVAERLQELLDRHVVLADNLESIDPEPGKITLLENLRFWPGEEQNDKQFASKLAGLGDVFVQDGFGVVHRAHASTDAITRQLPSVAGLLLEREMRLITQAMENPSRPLVAIFGGAKISDKIQVVEQFIDRADHLLIGGAMANTFFDYEGLEIGKSNYEPGQEEVIAHLIEKILWQQGREVEHDSSSHGRLCMHCAEKLELPTDVAVAKAIDKRERRKVVDVNNVENDEYILDVGPETTRRFQEIISGAGTVVWNGPLGLTELPDFAYGSNHIAKTLKEHKDSLTSIIGGGDTAGFAVQWDPDDGASFTHVSTGGGAALDLMAGKPMPGIDALD